MPVRAPAVKAISFWKVQSIGNDFPVVRLDDVDPGDLPRLAVVMSDRRFGIGGDGILAIGRDGDDLVLRMFNPDGTEDFCGNGLRAAARLGHDLGWARERFKIRHHGRIVSAGVDGERISTQIGRASYDPAMIPAAFASDPAATYHRKIIDWQGRVYTGSSLSTGSTHTVMMPGFPADGDFEPLSSAIEVLPVFPERTSVIWREAAGPDKVSIRIWERGAGETLGCGTGAAAVAVETMRERGEGGSIEVVSKGGSVVVSAESWDGEITASGQAQVVYEGVFFPPARSSSEAAGLEQPAILR